MPQTTPLDRPKPTRPTTTAVQLVPRVNTQHLERSDTLASCYWLAVLGPGNGTLQHARGVHVRARVHARYAIHVLETYL